MPAIETYFLDTNVLVKTCEYFRVKKKGGNVEKLEPYYNFVQQLSEDGNKLLINRISILEMYFLYHRQFYQKRKIEELAPFEEVFGKPYELENEEREQIEEIVSEFIKEIGKLGIEFTGVDQKDVLKLAQTLYRGAKPSVEPYDLEIYANSILENARYLVTDDGALRKTIDHFRKSYKKQIRSEIVDSFGEEKYPHWKRPHALPDALKPR